MRKHTPALVLVGTLLLNCGSALAAQSQISRTNPIATVAGEFVHGLPLGTTVRLTLSDGRRFKATVMGVEDDAVFIKPRTRIPEPPERVALTRIVDADVVHGASLGRAIGIGVAIGAGATVGMLSLLLAMWAD